MHIQITDFGTVKIFESDEEEGKTERERERERKLNIVMPIAFSCLSRVFTMYVVITVNNVCMCTHVCVCVCAYSNHRINAH